MVFNGDTDGQDLCTLADALASSNSVSFPLKKKALYANKRSREVWRAIWAAYGGWIADDSNNSGQPEVTTNLVTTARNLYLFASAQLIDGMSWLDANGLWRPLKPITLEEIQAKGIAEENFMTTASDPLYYRPVQNGVRIYPDSNAARVSALKAKIRRDIVAFASTSTNVSPGWDSILHEGLAIGMALDHAKASELSVAGGVLRNGSLTGLTRDWSEYLSDVSRHYARKFREHQPTMRRRKNVMHQYL